MGVNPVAGDHISWHLDQVFRRPGRIPSLSVTGIEIGLASHALSSAFYSAA